MDAEVLENILVTCGLTLFVSYLLTCPWIPKRIRPFCVMTAAVLASVSVMAAVIMAYFMIWI
jgi:hypothetical protein